MQLIFDVKDTESNVLDDFTVVINGKEVGMLPDKKTTNMQFAYKTKVNLIVKKLGFVDSTEGTHVVGAEEPNKLEEVQLVSYHFTTWVKILPFFLTFALSLRIQILLNAHSMGKVLYSSEKLEQQLRFMERSRGYLMDLMHFMFIILLVQEMTVQLLETTLIQIR